jgi:hypothetical protein
VGLVAGAGVPSLPRTEGLGSIVLKAEFAASYPTALTLQGPVAGRIHQLQHCVFELRKYRADSARVERCLNAIFPRAGIRPLMRKDLSFLIPFDSLTTREQAWNLFNADPEWSRVRHEVDCYQFGLYRVVA